MLSLQIWWLHLQVQNDRFTSPIATTITSPIVMKLNQYLVVVCAGTMAGPTCTGPRGELGNPQGGGLCRPASFWSRRWRTTSKTLEVFLSIQKKLQQRQNLEKKMKKQNCKNKLTSVDWNCNYLLQVYSFTS